MPISYVGAGSAVQTVTTTLTLAAPACAVDDVLFAQVISINNGAMTSPAGWTEIQQLNFTGSRGAVWYKRAVAADSAANFNFTVAGTQTSYGIIFAFRGVRPFGPAIGTSTASANAAADNVTYATLTPHSNSGVVVACGFYGEDATTAGTISGFNAPTIDTEQATNEDASLFMSYVQSTGAATGALTQATTSAVDAVNLGVLFDLMSIESSGGAGNGGGAKYARLERGGRR